MQKLKKLVLSILFVFVVNMLISDIDCHAQCYCLAMTKSVQHRSHLVKVSKKRKRRVKPNKVVIHKKYVILAAAHRDYHAEVTRLLSLVYRDLLDRYEVSESDVEARVVNLNASSVCTLYPNSFILKFGVDATFSNFACSRGKPLQTTLFAFQIKLPKNNGAKPKGYNDSVVFLVKQGADDIAQGLELRKKS